MVLKTFSRSCLRKGAFGIELDFEVLRGRAVPQDLQDWTVQTVETGTMASPDRMAETGTMASPDRMAETVLWDQ
jgi:hypothetical protein